MGNTQFYSPLKGSVDAIEILTNNIKTKVNEVDALVKDLKSTDIGNLNQQVANLGWFSKYKPMSSGTAPTTYTTDISITGEGILTGILHQASEGTLVDITCFVDGIYKVGVRVRANMTTDLMIPFKTSCVISNINNNMAVTKALYLLK